MFNFRKGPFNPAIEPRLLEPSFHNVLYSALPLDTLFAHRTAVRWGGMLDFQSQVTHDHHVSLLKPVAPSDTKAAMLPAWRQHNPTRGFGNRRDYAANGEPIPKARR